MLVGCFGIGEHAVKGCLDMSLINYLLVGLLGTIVGIALYMAKVELSHVSELRDVSEWTSLS